MQTIGFIGLGNMGGNMAARYLNAGYTVYGEDRDRDHAQWLVDQGLRWAATPRALAEAADVVLTSLPNDDIVDSVASGTDGIVAGLGEGKLWADLSTISPRASRALAERVRVQGHGAQMLDTPVSGSVPQVKSGTLTIMVGGDKDAYERIEPILRVLGTPTHVGTNGQGLVLKLAINISLAVQTVAFSEGLLFAEREGVDADLAANVMAASQIGSPMLKLRVPLILDPPDEAWFDIGLMHKDIGLVRQAGAEDGVPLPTAATADEILTKAEQLGYTHRDIASVHELLAQLSKDAAPVT
ncbi:MAG TPA: NAD(P)-dependent oxidoreductase [Solirubrobacteraceae bacterium]|nr:NAD(P)-dependent oxidoreductase [Solirubrobacteraceae bacterium]